MNLSYWERDFLLGKPDITIIGAGIVGLSCALSIKKNNPKTEVLVLDKGVLPSGASTKNAGFACFGSITELMDDVKNIGIDNMLTLVEKRWRGLQLLKQNLGIKNIDFQALGGYELFTQEDTGLYPDLAEQIAQYNQWLKPIIGNEVFSLVNEKISTFGFGDVSALLFNQYEGQINTGLMMKSLLKKVHEAGVHVINAVSVAHLKEAADYVEIQTTLGVIKTSQVAVCTNAFAKQLIPNIDVLPGRAQVLITKPIKNLKFKGTFHYDRGFYYFRNINDRLLIGGGRNVDLALETTTEMITTDTILNEIKHLINRVVLPNTNYAIDMSWAGIMGLGKSKEVIVKSVSKRINIGVRLGGMGVAIGSEIGDEVAQLTLN